MKAIEEIVRKVVSSAPKAVAPKTRASAVGAVGVPAMVPVKVGKYAFQSDDPEVVQYFNKIACGAEGVIPKKPKDFFELSDEDACVFIGKTLRTLMAHGCFDARAKFVALFVHDALAFTLCGKSPFTDVHRVALMALVGSTSCFARRGKMLEALAAPGVYEGLREASEDCDNIAYTHTLQAPEKKPASRKSSKSKPVVAAASAEVESEVEFEPVEEDDAEAEDLVQATGVFDGFLTAESPDRLSLGPEEDELVESDDSDAAPAAPSVPAAVAALEMVPTRVTGVPVAPSVPAVSSEFKRAAPESSSGVASEPPTKRVCVEGGALRKWEPMDVDTSGRVVVRGEEMSYEQWRMLPGDDNKYERYTRVGGVWMDVVQYYREYIKSAFPSVKNVDTLPPVQLKVRYNMRK